MQDESEAGPPQIGSRERPICCLVKKYFVFCETLCHFRSLMIKEVEKDQKIRFNSAAETAADGRVAAVLWIASSNRGGEMVTDLETVYVEHFDNVYKYVFSLCRNEAVSEEITQEAFYKAMEHMDRFDGRCKLYVWLCQIAKNTYFTYAKKKKRFISDTEAGFSQQVEPSFESEIIDKETAWKIHELLHQLSEPYKEVFSLRVFGELSFSQIGDLFGKTDSWARLIFYRAKKEIRRGLNENTM